MPELGPKRNEKLAKALDESESPYEDAERIAKRHGLEVIGSGAECVVVSLDEEGERVAGIVYHGLTPYEAKRLYYTHKIFSTLFPHNFPRMHAASGGRSEGKEPQTELSSTVRQRIDGFAKDIDGWTHKPEQGKFERLLAVLRLRNISSPEPPAVEYPFGDVRKTCREIDLPLRYDPTLDNFILGEDGGEYFVDTLIKGSAEEPDREKVFAYMRSQDYSAQDIRAVENSLKRLEVLEGEEQHEEQSRSVDETI